MLRTPRLCLRPLTPADAPAIVDGVGNYDVSRWLAVVPYPYGRPHADAFVAEAALQNGQTWGIEDESGLCGVISVVGGNLGFWLARPVWGRGYLTEAGDTVLDAWFAQRRAAPLRTSHLTGNHRSRHVLKKLGFVDVGEATVASAALRQTVAARRMEIARPRWLARRRYELATSGLRLRETRDRDLGALRRIGGDPRVAPTLCDIPTPWPEQLARAWLDAGRFRGRAAFRATLSRRGRIIGCFAIETARDRLASVFTWFLDPDLRDAESIIEAADAFLADVQDRFDVAALMSRRFADDHAGRAILAKLGFAEIGRDQARSAAQLEPAPVVVYRLERSILKAP